MFQLLLPLSPGEGFAIMQRGIAYEDIYNLDDASYAVELIAISKVIS
jgi:hypothetical protein